MKIRKCLTCGLVFEAHDSNQHACDACEFEIDAMDEAKARIEDRLREALEPDSTVEGTTKAFAEIMRLLPADPPDVDLTTTQARPKREGEA